MQHDNGIADVAPDGVAIDRAPKPRRAALRVWPLFVAFVFVLGASLVGGGVLSVLLVIVQTGGMPPASELESRLGQVVFSSAALVGLVSLSVFLLFSTSLTGAALSPQSIVERLRLRKRPTPWLAYPISILALIGLGQVLDNVAVRLGMRDGLSALDLLADAVAGMSTLGFVGLLIVGSLGAGIAEELFFRGYMQTRLVARWGVVVGLIVASAAFGILHFDPLHSTLAFFMGIYLGWLAELGGSVVLPIVAHVGNNVLSFVGMRFAENTVEAPASYLLVGASVALVCIVLLRRIVPPFEAVASPH